MNVADALSTPFDPEEVKWKPQVVKDNRCMAIAYVDARVVQDRLDDVLGVDGWQDGYEVLNDGCVVCTLRCKIGGEWISKTDVGSPSEQPDEHDRVKAGFSDALKRAAVKFGVGRYLYRLPSQWVDYDSKTKRITATPRLPAWAMPKSSGPTTAPPPPVKTGPAPNAKLASTLAMIDGELREKGVDKETLGKALSKYKAKDLDSLNQAQADDLLARLKSYRPAAPAEHGDAYEPENAAV